MYFVCRSLFFLGETFLNRKQWLTLEHADINRYHDTGAVVLDRNLLQLPGFYDNPSDKTALVSSNDERLTRILYETLNSVETHFLATRNFTWEGDDGRTNNGNGRSGCESIRDVGWGVGKVHRAERERFVVVPL